MKFPWTKKREEFDAVHKRLSDVRTDLVDIRQAGGSWVPISAFRKWRVGQNLMIDCVPGGR